MVYQIYYCHFSLEHFQDDCDTKSTTGNFNLNGVPKTCLQKRSTFMKELHNKTITVKTTRHRNIVKRQSYFFRRMYIRYSVETNMKKQTKTRQRR